MGTAVKANAFAKLGFGAVLAAGLAGGLLAVQALAPSENGVVQTAQAKASKAKVKRAKAAYRAFMETKGWKWGGSPVWGKKKQGNYDFATVDINGDGIPELIDYFTQGAASSYRARVYTYTEGRVSYVGKCWRVGPSKVYKKGHLLYHIYVSGGAFEISHFRISGGKLKRIAFASGSYFDPDPSLSGKHIGYHHGLTFKYQSLKINGKSVSWSGYKAGLKKLRKGSTKAKKIKYHTNTEVNRAKYL